ncbi:hypothetical protein M514_05958 [Trichuris suis]|uniref:Uncharacterized protein n=1 Tax=Trichuris suis TaxID=68888 RepID=A0A085M7Q2_9BILA|nr:hypothetical protein M513_05958 [Trichuris suis]KFD65538.1 hypothetical protein M514_05958 [Trichuris suis]
MELGEYSKLCLICEGTASIIDNTLGDAKLLSMQQRQPNSEPNKKHLRFGHERFGIADIRGDQLINVQIMVFKSRPRR